MSQHKTISLPKFPYTMVLTGRVKAPLLQIAQYNGYADTDVYYERETVFLLPPKINLFPVSCTVLTVADTLVNDNTTLINGKPSTNWESIIGSLDFTGQALSGGAGVALDLSELRGAGVDNGRGVVASGVPSFLPVLSSLNGYVKKGGKYKGGAITTYLNFSHPDILEYLTLHKSNIPWLKRAVYIDKFPEQPDYPLHEKDQQLLDLLISKYNQGDIFIVKKSYEEDGSRVYSNVCVTGDTFVKTNEGEVRVRDLVGKNFIAQVNGSFYKSGNPVNSDFKGFFSTGINRVYRLTLESGETLKLTIDHKIFTNKGLIPLHEIDNSHLICVDNGTIQPTYSKMKTSYYIGEEETFDCNIQDIHLFSANNIVVSNCLEILIKSRGSCMLAPINLALIEDFSQIPSQMVETLKAITAIWKQAPRLGIYLSSEEDRQVGVGFIGLANLLGREGITYKSLAEQFNYVASREPFDRLKVDDNTWEFYYHLQAGFLKCDYLAKREKLQRWSAIAPTVTCSMRQVDLDGQSVAMNIAPPLCHPVTKKLKRASESLGDISLEYPYYVESASEVDFQDYYDVVKGFQNLMDREGKGHSISFDTWDTMLVDRNFLADFLTNNVAGLYYRQAVKSMGNIGKSKIDVSPAKLDNLEKVGGLNEGVSCGMTEGCDSCGGD